MQQDRVHCQRLQDKTEDKESQYPGRKRWWEGWERRGFWKRSQVGTIQKISISKAQNQYIILHWRNNKERELNIWVKVKTQNRKELQLQALVDSECTYIVINKQFVKKGKIKTKPID